MKTKELEFLNRTGKNRKRARNWEMLINSVYVYVSKGL